MKTGTRTQVRPRAGRGSRGSCGSRRAASAPRRSRATRRRRSAPANGHHVVGDRRGELDAGVERQRRPVEGEAARRGRRAPRAAAASSSTPSRPGAAHRLVGRDRPSTRVRPRRAAASAPASRPSSCSSGWRRSPWGSSASAWAFTSGTTSGTSGSMRQADELSMTIAPAAASRGESSLRGRRARGRERDSMPEKSAVAASSTATGAPSQSSVRARRARGREEPDVVDREAALAQDRAHHGPDLAGGPDDRRSRMAGV